MINYVHHDEVWASGLAVQRTVTFTPRQLYPCGKSPRFSPHTKLGGAL